MQADMGAVAGQHSASGHWVSKHWVSKHWVSKHWVSKHRADSVTSTNDGAFVQCGLDRFVARDEAADMPDRQHGAVDDYPGEVHDTIGRCVNTATCRGEVDSAMTAGIGGRRRDELSHQYPGRVYRPVPGWSRCGGSRRRWYE